MLLSRQRTQRCQMTRDSLRESPRSVKAKASIRRPPTARFSQSYVRRHHVQNLTRIATLLLVDEQPPISINT